MASRLFLLPMFLLPWTCSLVGSPAFAMDRESYLRVLKIADQHVKRLQALKSDASGALSSSLVRELYGRYYEVGDWWEVAAAQITPSPMKRLVDPSLQGERVRAVGIFRYEVVKVKGGSAPEVTLKVTQLDAFGKKPVDPAIESLTLRMTDQLEQTEKTYFKKAGNSIMPMIASAEGVRSNMTRLELFPLDVPNARTALRIERKTIPGTVPSELQSIASQAEVSFDSEPGTWFEQDDFFGRPIQFFWHQGNPWPTYLKTSHGVAVLLRKGDA